MNERKRERLLPCGALAYSGNGKYGKQGEEKRKEWQGASTHRKSNEKRGQEDVMMEERRKKRKYYIGVGMKRKCETMSSKQFWRRGMKRIRCRVGPSEDNESVIGVRLTDECLTAIAAAQRVKQRIKITVTQVYGSSERV